MSKDVKKNPLPLQINCAMIQLVFSMLGFFLVLGNNPEGKWFVENFQEISFQSALQKQVPSD